MQQFNEAIKKHSVDDIRETMHQHIIKTSTALERIRVCRQASTWVEMSINSEVEISLLRLIIPGSLANSILYSDGSVSQIMTS